MEGKLKVIRHNLFSVQVVKLLSLVLIENGVITGVGSAGSKGKGQQISINDRVSVFLELAEAHRNLGEQVSFPLF